MVDATCSVPGCDRLLGSHGARGYCRSHYEWSRKRGWQEPAHVLGECERSTPDFLRVTAPESCSIPDCSAARVARGMCNSHYRWSRRRGGIVPTHRIWEYADVAKKLSVFVVDETTGCHLWQGRTNANGYGQVTTRGRAHMVHRLVWESVHGKLPPGLEIDHVAARGCRHRNCFNIEHLEPVTRQENVRRMWQQRKGA